MSESPETTPLSRDELAALNSCQNALDSTDPTLIRRYLADAARATVPAADEDRERLAALVRAALDHFDGDPAAALDFGDKADAVATYLLRAGISPSTGDAAHVWVGDHGVATGGNAPLPSTGDDRLREALATPPYGWLDEYAGAKGWDEAMDLIRAALSTGAPDTEEPA